MNVSHLLSVVCNSYAEDPATLLSLEPLQSPQVEKIYPDCPSNSSVVDRFHDASATYFSAPTFR